LFHNRGDLVATRAKAANQGLGFAVARNGDRKIRVAGKPRFGPDRYRQTADEREIGIGPNESSRDPMQGGFERGQATMHRLHGLPLTVVEQAVEVLTRRVALRLATEARTEPVEELPEALQQRAGRASGHGPQRSRPV
jgi:hypothetical protein